MSLENCTHENINSQNYCEECGILIQKFFADDAKNFTNGGVKNTKDIKKELANLEIDEEIKHKANEIFKDLAIKMPKIKKKRQSIFFCLYEACKQLDIKKDSHILASLIEMPVNDILTSLTAFSTTQTGYQTKITKTTAIDLIPDYCCRINFTATQMEEVKEIAEVVFKNNVELKEEMPRKMVAGILKYYMDINGITIDKTQFSTLMGFSEATLNTLFKKISNAYIK
jgi:transcription initiation factor TFIIIB Brf1 subunit/transcription initiation factor TFIIB